MASTVDICNLALSHIGDRATVASIDPPEGSAQAEHCARYYPVALGALLEMHDWHFATRRARLAPLDVDSWSWAFAYAAPAGALRIVSVLPATADSDAETQPYEREGGEDGAALIYTDQPEATARFIARVTDTTRFSELFTIALSWQLASMLAGPVLKGDAGAAESKRCAAVARAWLAEARAADANQRKSRPAHNPLWIAGR